jgi:hypothetical protein
MNTPVCKLFSFPKNSPHLWRRFSKISYFFTNSKLIFDTP